MVKNIQDVPGTTTPEIHMALDIRIYITIISYAARICHLIDNDLQLQKLNISCI